MIYLDAEILLHQQINEGVGWVEMSVTQQKQVWKVFAAGFAAASTAVKSCYILKYQS